jgi:hypothetical protein
VARLSTVLGNFSAVGAKPATAWQPLAGEEVTDYVLYRASTSQTAIWYMDDNVLVSGEFGPTPSG